MACELPSDGLSLVADTMATFNSVVSSLTDISDLNLSPSFELNTDIDETEERQTFDFVSPFDSYTSAAFPTFTDQVQLGSVSALTIPDEPAFDIDPPVLATIQSPTPFSKASPDAPLLGEQQFPDEPNEVMPTAPSLQSLSLPDAPTTLDLVFEGNLPESLEAAPDADFQFIEQGYQTDLLSGMVSKLELFVSGFSTGLPEEVEDQIWDRHRRRASISVRRLKTQNERYWGASGWNMPGGEVNRKNYEAEQDAVNVEVEASRDIAIAQADLEQKNFQFAFTTAKELEGLLIQHHDQVQQRALDAAKYAVQALIELYNAKVLEYNAGIEGYKALAQVYRDRIQGELAKVEVYKAQLEGQKLIGDLNSQAIAIYRERINAVLAIYELYKSKLEAVKTKMQGNELLLRQYESQIKAFETELSAKKLEYDQYKIANDVELTKSDVYKNNVEAYGKRVEANKTQVEARKLKQDAEIEIQKRIPLEVYKTQADVFKTNIESMVEQTKLEIESMKAEVQAWESQAKMADSQERTDIMRYDSHARLVEAKSRLNVERYKAESAVALSKAELKASLTESQSRIQAQLTAAAMGMYNYSVNCSQSYSEVESKSVSNSISSNTSTVNSTTNSTSKNTNINDSSSSSVSTQKIYTYSE